MNTAHTIAQEVDRHASAMRGVVDELKAHVKGLPDNPRIKRLDGGGRPRCFTLRFKDLGNNWTPEYHDFKQQYEMIVDDLEKCQPDDIIKRLLAICTEGCLNAKSPDFRYRQKLNPIAIQHIMSLAGFRWQSRAEWPKGACDAIGNVSTDTHATKEAAQSFCNALRLEGFGGNGKKFPLKVEITAVMEGVS